MKRFEKVSAIIFAIAVVMKLALVPGGGILATLSLLTLACIYYPFGFALFNKIKLKDIFSKESYKGISTLRIIGSIGAGIGLATVCVGILFKIQHWPGMITLLLTGLLIALVIAIVALIRLLKSKSDFYKSIVSRIAIIGGFGLLLFFTSDLTIVKIQFRNHPDYVKAYEKYLDNPQSEEAKKQLEIEYDRATQPR